MLKSENIGMKLLESIKSLNDASVQLYNMLPNNDEDSINQFVDIIKQLIAGMQVHFENLFKEEPALMSHLICKNILYSLENLMEYAKTNKEKAVFKIQFELLPLINELYVDLYFWGFCYPDKKKMWHYYNNEMKELCPIYVPEDGKYKYDVSVVVIAYNKLDYTKMCMLFFEKYFPKNINYELILYNNGSNDGTKEFFESFHPNKQIDFKNNTKSWDIISYVAEGKYILTISNDILILPNSIENLIKCIESDENIVCVMPTCPNVANLSTIPVTYSNEKEMVEFAKKNNVSDSFRWEQRTRLNPPVLLGRSDSEAVNAFFSYTYPFSEQRFLAFTDDLMGLIARRKGQKCMLAKDAYVHHFGSVTVNESVNQDGRAEFYNKYRLQFKKIFDIDPWGVGMCFDPEIVYSLKYEKQDKVNILGVNCGMGDTPLKVKAMIKEQCRNDSVKIYNITNEEACREDLNGLSDYFKFVTDLKQVKDAFPNIGFSYIVVNDINTSKEVLNDLFTKLDSGGVLAVRNINIYFSPEACIKSDKLKNWQVFYKN